MTKKAVEETLRTANLPILFKFNTQERKVILPYLLSHCQCKGNLSAILLRAMQIAHKHESALDARQRREPFIDAL